MTKQSDTASSRQRAMRSRHRFRPLAVTLGASLLLAGPAVAQRVGPDYPVPPSLEYGALYRAVELASIFPDSKTFPDMVPGSTPDAILLDYNIARTMPGFDLATFTNANFSGPTPAGPSVDPAKPGVHLLDYVAQLWPVLTQSSRVVRPYSTLLPLPYPYVVPGGRFREVYYWDSYFTMLGLDGDGQHARAVNMLKDFAFEIDRYGHIPNGDRSYYLSRSQPPFFSLMVELIAQTDGVATYTTYLPELQAEWNYWMSGAATVPRGSAYRNVVRLRDGTLLNRYWDERAAPRDESYKEDVQTAATSKQSPASIWRNLRATAESGWDFSSRWLADGKSLGTAQTLAIVPPDLNSLLFHLEQTLALGYQFRGDAAQASNYTRRATERANAIRRLLWNARAGAFTDYLWTEDKLSGQITAATLYPLFLQVASVAQASIVEATTRRELLDVGGLATTLVESGQQWDRPNGWAPLQWIAVQGLRNYGHPSLALEIATRWVEKNIAGFRQSAKLVEKYKVTTRGGDAGGGGEYATQIGFGWTNGVLVALTELYPALKAKAEAAVPDTSPVSAR